MSKPTRKTIFHVVRIAICLAAIVFVVRGVTWSDRLELADGSVVLGVVEADRDPIRVALPDGTVRTIPLAAVATDTDGSARITYGVRSTWARTNKSLLLVAFLIQLPVVVPLAVRLRVLLNAQGIGLRFADCLNMAFAGNFLNFATPLGSNAGDVFKAYFVSLHTPNRKTEAVATVILDRAIGLGTLIVIATCITCLSPKESVVATLRPYLLILSAIGCVVVLVYFSPWGQRLLAGTERRTHHPVFEQWHRLDRAARTLLAHPSRVVGAILLTVLLQVMALTGYFFVALALSFDAGLAQVGEFFAAFYVGAVVQALPGPPQGLGTVELAYRYFFAAFAGPSQIICMALLIRLINLVCAVPGLWVTMTGAYRPGSSEASVECPASKDAIGERRIAESAPSADVHATTSVLPTARTS